MLQSELFNNFLFLANDHSWFKNVFSSSIFAKTLSSFNWILFNILLYSYPLKYAFGLLRAFCKYFAKYLEAEIWSHYVVNIECSERAAHCTLIKNILKSGMNLAKSSY